MEDIDDFPYPQRLTRETFLKDLQIDPSNPSQSIINVQQSFNVDHFLHEHYRYTQLDDLQSELTTLLGDLDQELFDMVNNDYFDFINLGKTLEGGEALVDRLRVDVSKYRKRLLDEDKRLEVSQEKVKGGLESLRRLKVLKTHAQNMLILDSFIDKFEMLLSQNRESIQIEVLKQLTSLYLTIHEIITSLPNYHFVAHRLDAVNVLRHEFRGVLDEFLLKNAGSADVVEVLGIYTIMSEESHALEVLKSTTTN